MPTGYTNKVQDGTINELEDYILNCARNFGALIHMREDNLNIKIKPREANDYYLKRLNETKEDYEKFLKMTDEEIQSVLDKRYEQDLKEKEKGLKRFKEEKQRYLNMIEKVNNWSPPTEEHNNLKKFAIEQLESSLESDCGEYMEQYYHEEPLKDNIKDFKKYKLNSYLKDFERYSKSYREELENVDKTNKWITDLVESLQK